LAPLLQDGQVIQLIQGNTGGALIVHRAGEFVWRHPGSFHQTHSDEGAVILAIYRKPNVFQHGAGYARKAAL
jgi:hypothetical protein